MRFSFRLDSYRDYHYGTHPEEVNRLRRENNPATIKKYPILSFNDFVRSYFPKGVPNGEFAKYLKRALGHWKWKQLDTPNSSLQECEVVCFIRYCKTCNGVCCVFTD